MTNSNWQEPAGMMSPPVDFGGVPDKQSRWPTVIGIISIVLGSLGLLCYGCNTISTIASPFMQGMMPPEAQTAQPQGVQLIMTIVSYCLSTLLSILLLISGIATMQRKRSARQLSILWAFAKIIISLLSSAIGFAFAQQIADQVMQQMSGQGSQAPPFTITAGVIVVIIVVSLLFQLIWPTFLILWFSRAKIRDEVATWR